MQPVSHMSPEQIARMQLLRRAGEEGVRLGYITGPPNQRQYANSQAFYQLLALLRQDIGGNVYRFDITSKQVVVVPRVENSSPAIAAVPIPAARVTPVLTPAPTTAPISATAPAPANRAIPVPTQAPSAPILAAIATPVAGPAPTATSTSTGIAISSTTPPAPIAPPTPATAPAPAAIATPVNSQTPIAAPPSSAGGTRSGSGIPVNAIGVRVPQTTWERNYQALYAIDDWEDSKTPYKIAMWIATLCTFGVLYFAIWSVSECVDLYRNNRVTSTTSSQV